PPPIPCQPPPPPYTPHSRLLPLIFQSTQIILIDTHTDTLIHQLHHASLAYQNSYPGVRFTPDGRTLVSWGPNEKVRVWDPATGEERYPALEHDGPCYHTGHSRDGKLLVSASWAEKQARVWELATGKLLASLQHP